MEIKQHNRRILIGCECSGVMRRAFERHGWEAWSCDLMPAKDGHRNHFRMDVRKVLNFGWDAAIFHPVCTYLTCSAEWAYGDGPYHQKVKPETLVGAVRREARKLAVEFTLELANAPIPHKAIENPCGHLSSAWRKPDQGSGQLAPARWLNGGQTRRTVGRIISPHQMIAPVCVPKPTQVSPMQRLINGRDTSSTGKPHEIHRQIHILQAASSCCSPVREASKENKATPEAR